MIQLDAKLINESPNFKNAIGYQELTLRNRDISSIESGLSKNLSDIECIDFSNNCLIKLGNIPYVRRLKMLLLNNNCISEIDECLQDLLPQLDTLILTNNDLTELDEILPLSSIKTLRILSLIDNPVTEAPNYRLFVIYHIPQLEVLDFRYVLDTERRMAATLFRPVIDDDNGELALVIDDDHFDYGDEDTDDYCSDD